MLMPISKIKALMCLKINRSKNACVRIENNSCVYIENKKENPKYYIVKYYQRDIMLTFLSRKLNSSLTHLKCWDRSSGNMQP